MLFLQPLDVRGELQRFLVVAVTDTGVHQLRDFQNLQDLGVTIQRQAVHPPTRPDLFCFLHEASITEK